MNTLFGTDRSLLVMLAVLLCLPLATVMICLGLTCLAVLMGVL